MKFFDKIATGALKNPAIQKFLEGKLISFVVEYLTRQFSSNPMFFRVIQGISFAVAAFVKVPTWLASINVPVPTWLTHFESSSAAITAIIIMIISQLPNNDGSSTSSTVQVTATGTTFTNKTVSTSTPDPIPVTPIQANEPLNIKKQ
jgi:hypothetical protein